VASYREHGEIKTGANVAVGERSTAFFVQKERGFLTLCEVRLQVGNEFQQNAREDGKILVKKLKREWGVHRSQNGKEKTGTQ